MLLLASERLFDMAECGFIFVELHLSLVREHQDRHLLLFSRARTLRSCVRGATLGKGKQFRDCHNMDTSSIWWPLNDLTRCSEYGTLAKYSAFEGGRTFIGLALLNGIGAYCRNS